MTLKNDDTPVILLPDRLDPILEEEAVSQRFYAWMQIVSERIPMIGNGSPEDSLEANIGQLYIDKEGTQGNRIYFKTTNGGKTGWELV